jgi:hypothetical protein
MTLNDEPGHRMKAEEQREPSPDQARQQAQLLDSLVGLRLLDALGRRGDSYRAQVRRLWEGHYRVNLLTGDDAASTRIAASYFLVVDGEGSILASTPEITRQH